MFKIQFQILADLTKLALCYFLGSQQLGKCLYLKKKENKKKP